MTGDGTRVRFHLRGMAEFEVLSFSNNVPMVVVQLNNLKGPELFYSVYLSFNYFFDIYMHFQDRSQKTFLYTVWYQQLIFERTGQLCWDDDDKPIQGEAKAPTHHQKLYVRNAHQNHEISITHISKTFECLCMWWYLYAQ